MRNLKVRSEQRRLSAGHLPWQRILVPIDFSKLSLHALDVAVPLARDSGARLFLLFVMEPSAYAGFGGVVLVAQGAKLAKEARIKLLELARRLVPASASVSCLIRQGRPFEVITGIASEKNIDLIVLTTHGYTGLDRVLLGSTAERVVRHAPCSVLVVRPSRSKT